MLGLVVVVEDTEQTNKAARESSSAEGIFTKGDNMK